MTLRRMNTFAAFLCLLLAEESRAWTTKSPTVTQPQRYRSFASTALFQQPPQTDSDEFEYLLPENSSSSSRRRWLGNLCGTAAAAVGVVSTTSLPSWASSVVSSASVCDPTVSVWSKDGRIIYLLGTAHISSTSAALAGQLVRDTNPNGVFIELDPKRVSGTGALAQKFQGDENTPAPERESKIIVPQISAVPGDGGMALPSLSGGDALSDPTSTALPAKTKAQMQNPVMKAATAAVGKQIKGLYSRLDSAGFDSGEEFVTAVREGKKIGADIVLGDRDVEATLRRVTEGLTKTDLKAFLSPDSELERTLQSMTPVNAGVADRIAGSGSTDAAMELTDEQFKEELTSFVETMKTKENVRLIMGQLQRLAPFLYEALVSERDVYMATGLNGLNELESIVAVVGIAHADGIETSLQMNGWKAANPSCPK
mmetsp:Transcript_22626/g.53400  ORF Transcript_22626/g.53400 Transcript_22626/m.53400 type:complete len:427 (+) Transcript_22626:88-1368(+)